MPREYLSRDAENSKIVIFFDTDCSNARPVSLQVHFVDLLSNYPPGRSLDNSSEEGVTLLGVGEVLTLEDLKFSVLLDKCDDDDRVIWERGPENGRHHTRELHRGYTLWSQTT